MTPIAALTHWLWLLTIVVGAFALIRLYHAGLHRTYRFFFVYLGFQTLRSGVLMLFDPRTNAYAWTWVVTEAVIWVLYVLIVLELYSLVFRDYRGIYSLSQWALYAALAISLILSAVSLAATWNQQPEHYPILANIFLIERGVASSLVLFLLLIVAFLTWFPVPLSRNMVVHCVMFCVYFLSTSGSHLYRSLQGEQVQRAVSDVLLGVSLLCVTGWLTLLNRRGEEVPSGLRYQWKPADEQRLIGQLDALNRALSRSTNGRSSG